MSIYIGAPKPSDPTEPGAAPAPGGRRAGQGGALRPAAAFFSTLPRDRRQVEGAFVVEVRALAELKPNGENAPQKKDQNEQQQPHSLAHTPFLTKAAVMRPATQ